MFSKQRGMTMRRTYVGVLAAVAMCLLIPATLNLSAQEQQGGDAMAAEPIKLNKIYFLIHPLTYVPECEHSYSDKERYKAYRECENPVRRRYHEAIDNMGQDEALVIYVTLYPTKDDPHPQELVDIEVMARRKLGRRLVLCTYPTGIAEFVKLAKEQGLVYDLETVVTESWGESFDGCVAKYCSIFTTDLGLGKPMEQNFSMCVPDAAWALKVKFIEKVTLPSKIRFYVFQTEDGRPMAIFFEPYRRQGEPARFVDIALEPTKFETWRYVGSATPKVTTDLATPDGAGVRVPVCSHYTEPAHNATYLLGKDVDLATFQAALSQARLVE